jgi:hypothetical protein
MCMLKDCCVEQSGEDMPKGMGCSTQVPANTKMANVVWLKCMYTSR